MLNNCVGWDIGGAHVKAAVLNPAGEVSAVMQRPCPLWKGLEQLRAAVAEIMQSLPNVRYRHAITMTGELVDLFDNRDDGVKQIISVIQELLADDGLLVFAGQHGLLTIPQITTGHYAQIASANWLASAALVAQHIKNGLFIDIGSTTTDILQIREGRVLAQGFTDYERLLSQELVYTGIVRTAVMAVARRVVFEGREIGLMAEYFATMADVYRLTGELHEAHDQTDTADGAEKSVAASARRLARMIGCDFYAEELKRWQEFASVIRGRQLQHIKSSCRQLLSNNPDRQCVLVGAGIGRFLAEQIAQELGYAYLDFSTLCAQNTKQIVINTADCAPAVAVAVLAHSFEFTPDTR